MAEEKLIYDVGAEFYLKRPFRALHLTDGRPISIFWSTSKMTKEPGSHSSGDRGPRRVVMLSPAFNFPYSPFDKALGHYRRYTPKDAVRLTIPSLTLKRLFFPDGLGYFVSAVNRLVLQASQPSIQQIQFWDKAIVPVSGLTDKIFVRL